MRINYFKRIQAPPIIVLSKRAFGFDLRESQLPGYSPRAYERVKRAMASVAGRQIAECSYSGIATRPLGRPSTATDRSARQVNEIR